MKKVNKEEVKVVSSLYPKEDRLEILRLFKVAVAGQEDLDSIFRLYKKYVNPGATTYQTNCNCSISIQRFYQDLLNWYSDNGSKFE
jgi:hypothetical protein